MDEKGRNIKQSARANADRHINNKTSTRRKSSGSANQQNSQAQAAAKSREAQARSAELARAAKARQQQEALNAQNADKTAAGSTAASKAKKKKSASKRTAQTRRAKQSVQSRQSKQKAKRRAVMQQSNTRTSTNAAIKNKASNRKKYKINYKRFIPFVIVVVAVFVLLIVLLKSIFGGGSKTGWYAAYVSPSSDARVGIVTKLTDEGLPETVDLAAESSDGVYQIPIQCGGTTTVIVADENYSFNRVNQDDANYYLVSITATTSSDSEDQAEFVEKYSPSVIKASTKKIDSSSTEKLPDLNVYSDSSGKNAVATLKIGSAHPSYDVDSLDYIGKDKPEAPAKSDEVTTFTFSASGDNLIHQRIYEQAAERADGDGYDFTYCYESVKSFYQEHDLNWFNQESLLNNTFDADTYPTFSTPGEDGQALYDVLNARVFSTSNNHSYDKGEEGVEASVDFYTNDMPSDILATGFFERDNLYDIPIYTCNGRSVAFLSYTYGTNGNTVSSTSKYRVVYTDELDVIQKQVEKANEVADIVIVGCHWGTEDSHVIQDSQKELAQNLANWGADLIIGTHPHVVQNAEWIDASDGRKVFCAYSLGNFLSTQAEPDELVGLVLDCTFETTITPEGEVSVEIKSPKLIPTVTVYGEDASNTHVVWLSDYSESAAASHGVKSSNSSWSYSYITTMLQRYVDGDYLVLPEGTSTSATTTTKSSSTTTTTSAETTQLSDKGTGRDSSGPVGLAALG